ncbi:MAG: hypothetical protein Q8K87_09675 [Hydrogenophaga sp.]|nr:hypothetical protein [Hydrogenophaga sp.]
MVTQARVEWPHGLEIHATSDLPKSIFAEDDVVVSARLKTQDEGSLIRPVRLYGRFDTADETTVGADDEVCHAPGLLQAGLSAPKFKPVAACSSFALVQLPVGRGSMTF